VLFAFGSAPSPLMPKFAQFVIGPAGCGKSSYCATIQEHFKVALRRTARVINLDPAAETFEYDCELDVRDLISVEDVMEELEYGPNGGLVYAMEYIVDNLQWLEEHLSGFGDDDYFLFDCPGQIELYSHLPCMRELVDFLQGMDFRIAGVYCIDVNFVEDKPKFLSGALAALTAMVNLELPHVNVLTKCDLMSDEVDLDQFLEGDADSIARDLSVGMQPRYRALNEAMASLLDEFALVSFVALNREDEGSVELALAHVNHCIQYGEDLEPSGKYIDMNDDKNEDMDF